MVEKSQFFVVRRKAVPEVLLRVVEAKQLMDANMAATVQEAVEKAGISRSSFYKYKDDIFLFRESARDKTITFSMQMNDEPGLLSDVLKIIAACHANILTIHQSIPIGGMASTTVSVDILADTGDISAMLAEIEQKPGIQSLRILGQEG